MAQERLGPGDLLVLASERRATVPMQLGAWLAFDPATAPRAELALATVRERLTAVPRLRERLWWPSGDSRRPVWVRDATFDAARHVALHRAARPDDVRAGLDLLADLVVERLPPDRPLWRGAVLEGSDGRALGVAVVLHHVVADGVGALAVFAALGDPDPQALPAGTGPTAHARTAGGRADRRARRRPPRRRTVTSLAQVAHGIRQLGLTRPRLAGRTSLLAPTGPRRRVDVVQVDLESFHEAARARGASVNDLVLVAVSGALGRLLEHRGDRLETLVVSVPVAAARGADEALGNAVGVVPVSVPLRADPSQRLAAVRAQRGRFEAGPRGSSTSVLGPAFGLLARLGFFQWFIAHQRLVHTFETNVRGPAAPPRVAGGRVSEVVPMAVNPGNVTVSFDVLSAGGRLVIAVVTDPRRVPDDDVLRAALEEEVASLAAARR